MTWLLWLLGCGEPTPAPAPERPPIVGAGPSLYDLQLDLEDQDGAARGLDLARGHPTLVSMFYTSCPNACPLLIQRIQGIEARLDPATRADLRVVLVSLDPQRDDPAAMRAAIARFDLDERWTLARTARVPELAAVLGIAWRPDASGGFDHTSVLTLIDGEGRIAARIEGADEGPLLTALGAR